MWIIRNNIIPFGKYKAVNLFGIVFCKKNANMDDKTIRHEKIHTAQIREMLFIFFYLWYSIEYLVKLIMIGSNRNSYMAIGFEMEAYVNQDDEHYLDNRKHYSWWKLL